VKYCVLPVKPVTVKFTKGSRAAPLIVLSTRVNEVGPLRFLLDTGASHTCIAPQLVQRLALDLRGRAQALGAGGELDLQLTRIDSLSIGAATVRRLTVAVVDVDHVTKLLRRIDGVVGNDFLKHFVVTIDYRRGTLRLA
jgi:predicted aspartyl protease